MGEKKTDAFINFKYKEVQTVIEDKWYLIKELTEISDAFMVMENDIDPKKVGV